MKITQYRTTDPVLFFKDKITKEDILYSEKPLKRRIAQFRLNSPAHKLLDNAEAIDLDLEGTRLYISKGKEFKIYMPARQFSATALLSALNGCTIMETEYALQEDHRGLFIELEVF